MASLSTSAILLAAGYGALFLLWAGSSVVLIPIPANLIMTTTAIIYVGCHRSLRLRDRGSLGPAQSEVISKDDAYQFPLIGSAVLFGLYVVFKLFNKAILKCRCRDDVAIRFLNDPPPRRIVSLPQKAARRSPATVRSHSLPLRRRSTTTPPARRAVARTLRAHSALASGVWQDLINLLLSIYFSVLGAYTLGATAEPALASLLDAPGAWHARTVLELRERELPLGLGPVGPLHATPLGLACAAGALALAGAYFKTKHWLLNNLFGVSFCIQGMERISLGSFKVGAILLVGLFFYDIFWVFGTPVMVEVAKSFDAPIKVPTYLDAPHTPRAVSRGSAVRR